ncbi:MAG: O-methyltransferase [Muribaculum sp.]|nr:O-methyltransferase [Muribaculum sp.]
MTVEEYIELYSSPEPEPLHRLVRESNLQMVHGRMCSGHVQGRLLKMLVTMLRPERVLELGTFTGYSALCIAEGLSAVHSEGTLPKLITVEANDENEDFIRERLAESPYGKYVDLRIGEAMALMGRMPDNSFDMVFIDADKRAYADFYREAKRLLRPGGFILADNTLWDGKVVEEGHVPPQTAGIQRFNALVAEDPDTEQVILPMRDGLTLIRIV